MKKKKSKFINPSGDDHKILRSCLVEKIVPGGDGLIRVEGKVCFVPGVLPGEIIDVRIDKEGKKFSRGSLLDIIQPSQERVVPFCSLYGRCGGCNMQHMNYALQLSLKEEFVREHFRKMAGITLPDDFFFVPSKEQNYRNRVQFHNTGHQPGFKMRSAEDVIPVQTCPVLVDALNDFLSADPHLNGERETVFGYEKTCWKEDDQSTIRVGIASKEVSFRAGLFFQSNLSILPDLLEFALKDYSGLHAMDLYCGVGLFSVFLRDRFRMITGIELNPETEPYYRANMEGSDYRFYGISLEQWLNRKGSGNADLIVVDPPRTGLSEKVRSFLKEMKVPDLVYVSCDPVTQARDAAELAASGYKLADIRGFDFYPQTNHMETVCRFTRK